MVMRKKQSNLAVEWDGHKLRLWFPTLRSGRPSLLRVSALDMKSNSTDHHGEKVLQTFEGYGSILGFGVGPSSARFLSRALTFMNGQ